MSIEENKAIAGEVGLDDGATVLQQLGLIKPGLSRAAERPGPQC